MSKIIFTFLIIMLLGGCNQQQVEESKLRQNIGELLQKYQQAVNTLDQKALENILSDSFSFYQTDKKTYIQNVLKETVLIDSYSYTNIHIENYKIYCDVNLQGSLIYKPEINSPLFKELPYIQGKQQSQSAFVFVYEQDGLKIFAEDRVLITRDFTWGQALPKLIEPTLSSNRASPGSTIGVNFKFDKNSQNDIAFVYLNQLNLGSYAQAGGDEVRELSSQVHIPSDFSKGKEFPITFTALAGKTNLNDPQNATLQGLVIKTYLIPIR